ncbi:hypothetical protein DYB34_012896 [Aphanomyces astaci]|uniref:Uncharacterized protein n=1 Tax=Aphanomyces astaci TaxID=112090 RepID=A0A418CB24_APHAT|nr:hypothetical protein DYB34_012896 [Aphanomyces astaci]
MTGTVCTHQNAKKLVRRIRCPRYIETDDHKSILDKLGGVECPDVALKASLQVQLDAIHQRHSHELQQLHQTFLAECGEPNATVAMSKTGGWSDHDHDHYIKLFKDCKRDAKADMAAHQAEIARLEADAIQVAADRKRLKEHELKKKLLQDHSWQQVDMLAQDEATALKRAIEAEELKERDAVNAERVAFRVEEYERLRVLEAIKQETPYAEKLNQIERTRQPTVAFTANVDAIQDGLGVHETGLFPSHGYDTEKLFKDARFKLGLALRDAGLGSTDYARKAMSTITVRNTGAYRHTPQAPTQLW